MANADSADTLGIRLLNSRRLGLALSGGGARGLAHIGVLRVLDEEGIPISALSGSSMGGLVAAAYATGVSPPQLEAEARRMSSLRELAGLVEIIPWRGFLLDHIRVERFLRERLQLDCDFSEVKIPLAVTAVALHGNKLSILTEGSVLQAVRATTAVPGLFAPVRKDGERFVDGGILNNLPVDLLPGLGAQALVAVDVGFELMWDHPEENIPLLSAMPSVATDIYKALLIMMTTVTEANLRRSPPDLLIRPDLPDDIGFLTGFQHPQGIIEAGADAAKEALPRLRQLLRPTPFPRLRRLLELDWE
jgi:NTE family protein